MLGAASWFLLAVTENLLKTQKQLQDIEVQALTSFVTFSNSALSTIGWPVVYVPVKS